MMNLNENKITMSEQEGLEAIMAILEGSPDVVPVNAMAPKNEITEPKQAPKDVTYDGRGHIVEIDGKTTVVGPTKKKAKRVKNTNDLAKDDLMTAAEIVLHRVPAFKNKLGKSKQEGLIIRMSDADYTVKVTGHAKREFENREENFTPEVVYTTRGKTENHAPAIAKLLVNEIENENSIFKTENQISLTLLEAKASGVRLEAELADGQKVEFSFKITKKRARVVMD